MMRTERHIGGGLIVVCLVSVLSGCDRPPRQANKVHIIGAGFPGTLAYLPHVLAQELGFYKEEGLEVQAESVPGGTNAMQALLGGSADVVAGYYEHSIRVAAQGRAVKSFIVMTRYPGNVLLVGPGAKKNIRRIEDLKGAAIGVNDPGSQGHLFVNYLLVRNGLAPSDITVVSVGTAPGGIAALEHGKIDVWAGFDPGVTQFVHRHPDARILVDARDGQGVREVFGTDVYPGATLYSKANWLAQYPDIARRLVRANLHSLHWIHQHSPEEIAAKVPAALRGEDSSIYIEALRRAMPMFSEDGLMEADGANAAFNALRTSLESVRSAKIDLSKTYTNEFVARR
jgi:NitT/TauT family transport system substrate-binding protein